MYSGFVRNPQAVLKGCVRHEKKCSVEFVRNQNKHIVVIFFSLKRSLKEYKDDHCSVSSLYASETTTNLRKATNSEIQILIKRIDKNMGKVTPYQGSAPENGSGNQPEFPTKKPDNFP